MEKEVKIVIGSLFGDEGKGVTVQWLCREAIEKGKSVCVVRYCGGPQAAHTVVNDGVEHICSSYGSGVLLGVPTYYIYGSLFDPICAYNEYKVLQTKMDSVPLINIADYIECITPYDVISNRNDESALKDGTCGKGVWACKKRHMSSDYFLYTFSQFLTYKHKEKQFQSVCDYYGMERNPELERMYVEACNAKFYKVWKNRLMMIDEIRSHDVVIFEGTQGLLLDAKDGFFPNVTATPVGLENPLEFMEHYEFNIKPEVYMVTRTYLTRHGNGYIPQAPLTYDLSDKHETNVFNEYQGNFKVGQLERRLFERAVDRHRLDYIDKKGLADFNLVVTHMDVAINHGFLEMYNGCFTETVDLTQPYGMQSAMTMISSCFDIHFKNFYYNDSNESDIKLFK